MAVKGKPNYQPKKDSKFKANGAPKVEWKGYVNWELTKAHVRAFDEWVASNPDFDGLLQKAVRDGYDFKVRYDERNDAMSAQFYCQSANNPNAGWCLSMRSNDWWKAVQRLIFVHFIALQEAWSTQGEEGWTDDKW